MILLIGKCHVTNGTKQGLRYSAMRITSKMLRSILLTTSTPKYQIEIARHGQLDASKSDTERIRSSLTRRKCSTEGTGLQSLLLWRKQMTKVTYRGVEYNAEEYNAKVLAEASKRNRHELMYRGLKVTSKA